MVERTRREIRRLSPRLRDTLLLAASGHYTYEEIAGMLGVPVGTVKWRVSEARRLVTARLRDAGGPR
jgi:RNA polymerase sigma-70 factor (ECF subfamily)